MRRRLESGTSLIEVLTVIVVFLVGILGLLQAFPTGLGLLRTTRSNTLAATLARAEMQRVQAAAETMPEMVVPVTYRAGGTVIEVNAGIPWTDLMPERDPSGGQLDQDGNILISGASIGGWQRVSGANKFNRVIGEGRRVPGPTGTGASAGSLLQLQYSPIYYSRSTATGVSVPGILSVYANDLLRRWGNTERNRPNPSRPGREYEFFYVDGEAAENSPFFANEDQIWVPVVRDSGGSPILAPLRISLAFSYDTGSGVNQHEVIVILDPASAGTSVIQANSDWMVVNLRQVVAEPGAYGSSGFDPGSFLGAEGSSVRVQRMYQEIPLSQAFASGNPFQFKALNGSMGSLLINPAASLYKMAQADGTLVPLEANTDYTVLDWRLMRDAFRIPQSSAWPSLRLALGSIKPMSTPDTDGQPYEGLGFPSPNGDNVEEVTDFVLIDEATGGVILGNQPGATFSSYFVDKRNGVITFIDRDTAPGVQVYLSTPQGTGWGAPVLVDAAHRSVRALYQASGEWAVQLHKAASSYRVTNWTTSSGLQPGEVFVGGSPDGTGTPVGEPSRLYFPLSDLGHRVSVQEIRYTAGGGGNRVVRDQELNIDGTEQVNGATLAFADISRRTGAGTIFDASRTGFAVRGVKGVSFRVRVLWNPERFALLPDPADNYSQFEAWQRQTRPIQTEGFISPGASQ